MRLSHVIGIDDAPFGRLRRGDVRIVGAVFARARLEGVVSSTVRRDGVNSTHEIARLVTATKFAPQLQLIMLQGIALAGFNVVDLRALHDRTGRPVLVVARQAPDLARIRRALLDHVRGGARRWRLIEAAGPMEKVGRVWVQRAGLSRSQAESVLAATCLHGNVPEPLRVAHLIAGGVTAGQSRGRA
jgi:endonuclease V-like protein UPF0215 family